MTALPRLLLLAGGRSRRMGRDKCALPFPGPRDPPLITWGARALAEVATPPLVAGPSDYGTGWTVVDDAPDLPGPAGGLLAGLRAAGSELVLVLAADAPFPSPRLAQLMTRLARAEPTPQAVIPLRQGRLEPLFGVYRSDGAADLEVAAAQPRSGGQGPPLRAILQAVRVRPVLEAEWRPLDPEGFSFINCNTPRELAAAAARAVAEIDQGGRL
ncbi:MAG: molybdenum cofactor guanylyltransferase [Candidatus Dormibacteria bacterium]